MDDLWREVDSTYPAESRLRALERLETAAALDAVAVADRLEELAARPGEQLEPAFRRVALRLRARHHRDEVDARSAISLPEAALRMELTESLVRQSDATSSVQLAEMALANHSFEAAPVLAYRLEIETDGPTRTILLQAIGALGGLDFLPILKVASRSTSEADRRGAIEGLAYLPGKEALRLLVERVGDKVASIRDRVLEILATVPPDPVLALATAIPQGRATGIRRGMVRWLAGRQLVEAEDLLVHWIGDPDPLVAGEVLLALADRRHPAARDRMTFLAGSDDPKVRRLLHLAQKRFHKAGGEGGTDSGMASGVRGTEARDPVSSPGESSSGVGGWGGSEADPEEPARSGPPRDPRPPASSLPGRPDELPSWAPERPAEAVWPDPESQVPPAPSEPARRQGDERSLETRDTVVGPAPAPAPAELPSEEIEARPDGGPAGRSSPPGPAATAPGASDWREPAPLLPRPDPRAGVGGGQLDIPAVASGPAPSSEPAPGSRDEPGPEATPGGPRVPSPPLPRAAPPRTGQVSWFRVGLLLGLLFALGATFRHYAAARRLEVTTDERRARLAQDFETLSKALVASEEGLATRFVEEDFQSLVPQFLPQVPMDPWGRRYRFEPVLRRVFSPGPDGLVDPPAPFVIRGSPPDDRFQFVDRSPSVMAVTFLDQEKERVVVVLPGTPELRLWTTPGSSRSPLQPIATSSGSRLAYRWHDPERNAFGAEVRRQEVVGGRDWEDPRPLAPPGFTIRTLAWMPDGSGLVAVGGPPEDGEGLWILEADAAPRPILTVEDLREPEGPSVSADGKRIAISAKDRKGTRRIAVVDLESPDGLGRNAVVWGPEGRAPAYSPVGETVWYLGPAAEGSVVAGTRSVRVWAGARSGDPRSQIRYTAEEELILLVASEPDRRLALATRSRVGVLLPKTGAVTWVFEAPGVVSGVAWPFPARLESE